MITETLYQYQPDLLTEDDLLEVEKRHRSNFLFQEAKVILVEMNLQRDTFADMRDFVGHDDYIDLLEFHEKSLHWLIEQWENHFKTTGKRFSNE